jgi:menaquinol-cytochrome c reductase iron-sulfur subunit
MSSDTPNLEAADSGPSESPQTENVQPDAGTTDTGPPRRGFLVQFIAGAIGAFVGTIPAIFGTLFFLDPLIRRKSAGQPDAESDAEPGGVVKREGFIRMAVTVDALPDDGTPQRYTVFDDIIDAWNKFPNQPRGAVWLRKIEGQVIAFNTICPHLGCDVEHRLAENEFYCPCHASAFDLDGTKKNPIPPRDMDSLEVNPDGKDWIKDGEIWIKYEKFRAATSERVPV